jgi:hypothetical protein
MTSLDWVIVGLVVLRLLAEVLPPHWWYVAPRKRRAMRSALRAVREAHGARPHWSGCRVARADAEKCFVVLTHRGSGFPSTCSLFVLWHQGGLGDDLGVWQFHRGYRLEDAIGHYEACRAAGIPWAAGMSQHLLFRSPNEDAG